MEGVPTVRFARARRGRVAYQLFGGGETTIVAIPPSAQNIEAAWERTEIRNMLEQFASFSRYLHYDKLGTGASDRSRLVSGIDERVDELRAVMDDAEIERAHLFAQSEGGPVTLLFAASYPDRVESITLMGSAARMSTDEIDRADSEAQRALFAELWGTADSLAVDIFAPSMCDDAGFRAWHQRYERLAASADSLKDLLFQMLDVDVRESLGRIEAPVLVMNRAADQAVPIELGREAADLIPDATFVEVSGVDHFAYLGDVDEWMNHLERFVTGTVAPRPSAPRPPDVSIGTLGRFAVTAGGVEVPTKAWGSRRARTLLKRLIVARGWPVTRDEIADLLWPDETDPSRLGPRLSVQLSAVRRVLNGGIIADRQTVALDLDHVKVDVEDLLMSDDDRRTLTCYTGEFLPEERYADWAAPLREEARNHFTRAAHRCLSSAMANDELTRAIELAGRILDADPYDEVAHAALAEAHERDGDPAAASRSRRRRDEVMEELFRKDP